MRLDGEDKEFVERGPLDFFVFTGLCGAGVKILRIEGTKIEFIEGIGFFGLVLGDFFGFGFEEGFVGVAFGYDSILAELFEDGIGHDLLIDHFAQLEAVEGEDAHHLDQPRRQNLLLRDAEIKFWLQPVHFGRS